MQALTWVDFLLKLITQRLLRLLAVAAILVQIHLDVLQHAQGHDVAVAHRQHEPDDAQKDKQVTFQL